MRSGCIVILIVCSLAAAAARARGQSYQDDVGYTRLQAQQGEATPNGAGVPVTQIEGDVDKGVDDFFPDTTDPEFSGKTITPDSTPYSTSYHATVVGRYFYGNDSSLAPGITSVNVYEADDWAGNQFLNTNTNSLPDYTTDRVANHSYIGEFDTDAGTFEPAMTLDALHRFDYVIQHDDYINVVAVDDPGGAQYAQWADSFNAISVGLTDGMAASGTTGNLDDPQNLYVAGRAAPDVVTPLGETSYATPLVASAAAMLVEFAHNNPSLSSASFISPRTGLTLEYAETADVIKAAIMAGADRVTNNGYNDDISYYGQSGDQTQNGLDTRYGAGQLDVYNSYHIIAAGQQGPGTIGTYGFDYNPASSDSAVEDYTFSGHYGVAATLAWNIHIDDDMNATLANYQLHLYQLTNDGSIAIAASVSTIDNTQNIYVNGLDSADTYELEVTRTDNLGDWDYGLAWDLAPAPEPAAAPAIAVAMGMVALLRRRNPKHFPMSN